MNGSRSHDATVRTSGIGVAVLSVTMVSVLLGGTVACGGNGSPAERDAEKATGSARAEEGKDEYDPTTVAEGRKRKENLRNGDLRVETYDLNRDQKTDQWAYKNESGTTVRIERDMNFDGEVDVWQYPGPEGTVVEEEMDLDMDGIVDVVAYYEEGTVRRKEMAVNFRRDYAIDKFYDKQGNLLRVERDEDGDGSVDVWEYYDGDGNRERIGWDENDDGVPDSFDNLP